jgi:hypothetical protein
MTTTSVKPKHRYIESAKGYDEFKKAFYKFMNENDMSTVQGCMIIQILNGFYYQSPDCRGNDA